MIPSSARRPLGHHPPEGIPNSRETSRAARSTPVWPPETILETKLDANEFDDRNGEHFNRFMKVLGYHPLQFSASMLQKSKPCSIASSSAMWVCGWVSNQRRGILGLTDSRDSVLSRAMAYVLMCRAGKGKGL